MTQLPNYLITQLPNNQVFIKGQAVYYVKRNSWACLWTLMLTPTQILRIPLTASVVHHREIADSHFAEAFPIRFRSRGHQQDFPNLSANPWEGNALCLVTSYQASPHGMTSSNPSLSQPGHFLQDCSQRIAAELINDDPAEQ